MERIVTIDSNQNALLSVKETYCTTVISRFFFYNVMYTNFVEKIVLFVWINTKTCTKLKPHVISLSIIKRVGLNKQEKIVFCAGMLEQNI